MITAPQATVYPSEVLAVAGRMGGGTMLDTIRELSRQYFPYASVGEFEAMSDLEAGEEWITLSLRVRGPVRRFLEDETAFARVWQSRVNEEHWRFFTLLPDFE